MILKRFLVRVIVLVILIALTGLLVVWSFTQGSLVIARFTFIIAWVGLVTLLISYVTKTNRTLKVFVDSIRYLDKVRVQKGKGRTFEELDKIYNEVLGVIRKTEMEKETDRLYYKSIIDHAGTGMLSFDETGKVEVVNKAFRNLLGIQHIENIETLSVVSPQLPEILRFTKPGKQKLLRVSIKNETLGLWVKIAEFRMSDKRLRLVSLSNIQHELEEEELDAWQKLIRVLTHEIMNSITPVNSLTNTIIRIFEKDGIPRTSSEIDGDSIRNALEGLHSIEKRNKGLISFVQSYRSLTRVQKPVFDEFNVNDLLLRIGHLVKREVESHRIRFIVNTRNEVLTVNADEKLVEQVLINLINNAVYAVRETNEPEISMGARKLNDELLIEVADNGEGIALEIISSIFIPFFTTKNEGSGIGLSLSRQIMQVHGGSIHVRSKPGETVFFLKFPC